MNNIVIISGTGFVDSQVVRLYANKYPENNTIQR